jgi:U4/U6.U5 tri-snRNP-associated protein 2
MAAPRPPAASSPVCPYLDTVQRNLLDFDMQKLCSVSLSPHHVYACLVCGKFFQGRGRHTHAYTHSVQAGHHVFINLEDGRVYCLPDSYEVTDASLDDIKYALHPRFPREALAAMDRSNKLATDMSGASFLPGFVGVNNLTRTDYLAVVVHALAHVHPLRNYFLDPANYAGCGSGLVQRFGQLVRRLWSPGAFKATVSPVEFLVEVSTASGKRFGAGQPTDALEFLTWLLNTLHEHLTAEPTVPTTTTTTTVTAGSGGGSAPSSSTSAASSSSSAASAAAGAKRPRPASVAGAKQPAQSIITLAFQGEVEVETLMSELLVAQAAERARKAAEKRRADGEYVPSDEEDEDAGDSKKAKPGGAGAGSSTSSSAAAGGVKFPVVARLPFLMLSLDLPPTPLFKDDEGGRVIAQAPLYTLLAKFDGVTVSDSLRGQYRERKRYRITRLPPYLLMAVRRFGRNAFFHEKNPSIVTFPLKNLEMRPYAAAALAAAATATDPATGKPLPAVEDLPALPVAELKALVRRLPRAPVAAAGAAAEVEAAPLDKGELVAAAAAAVTAATAAAASAAGTKYDLVANVAHDTPAEVGTADPLAAGSYRVHVQHEGGSGSAGTAAAGSGGAQAHTHQQWYEVRDHHVTEALPQMIGISETCLMVFRRQGYAPPATFPPALVRR